MAVAPVEPYLTGKNVVLTGCTNGIGEAWVYKVVSSSPACLIIVNRNKGRADELIEKLKLARGGNRVSFRSVIADLSEPKKVQAAVNEILGFGVPIHVVLCNAGIWLADGTKYRAKQTNSEGIEMHVATNFLSMVVLLRGLQENMLNAAKASGENTRCVITGSHTTIEQEPKGVLDLENLNCDKKWETSPSSALCNDLAYVQSKLMQHMWARKFAKEVKEAAGTDPKIDIIVFDPGMVISNADAYDTLRKKLGCCFDCVVKGILKGRDTDSGATPGQWAATRPVEVIKAEEDKNGEPGLYLDCFKSGDPMVALRQGAGGGFAKLEYYPMFKKSAPSTQNWEHVEAVWKQAEVWRGASN
jgi:NAD(P)-dependent dehydrogenase (short-subunit alcohol dehydrogenase family)